MSEPHALIRIHPEDNVAVAVRDVEPGETLEVTVRERIGKGHKVALTRIDAGSDVIKYGHPIGKATASIEPGTRVHEHNLATALGELLEYDYKPVNAPIRPVESSLTFDGYVRSDGRVGVRNEVWIVPTVGCVNSTAQQLVKQARTELDLTGVDGIHAWPHPYGCSQLGDDHVHTQQLLASMVHHPNAAGVLILGLGCENNNIDVFRPVLGEIDPNRVKYLGTQAVEDEFESGMAILTELVRYAQSCYRKPVPLSRLVVGLKCGASDGFSGITANPLLGAFSDRLTQGGGSTLLTEVPEMFGAETLLMNRSVNRDVFEKCVRLINDFKRYYQSHDQPIYENPAPGNKAGGITTLEEKSLGCTQKGGSSPVVDVLDYARPIERNGLNLVQAPGNDIVSVTALAAAGAQIVLFTTGRGTPLGGCVPTIKVSTHSELAKRKRTWIDFDAGGILDGASIDVLADQLMLKVIEVASGRQLTCNERNDNREIAIFKDGVTL